MKILRIVSDVHGFDQQHYDMVKDCDYSVQLGDFNFNYNILSKLDSKRHKLIGGNHDNYDLYYDCPNSLGDFGNVKLGPFKFFFFRGGFSLDKPFRIEYNKKTGQKVWWEKEELGDEDCIKAIELYSKSKPKLVLSHDCPTEISKEIGNPEKLKMYGFSELTTITKETLQCMFKQHQPDMWVFGHYHRNIMFNRNGTTFLCMRELGYTDINTKLNIIRRS